ncbi:MAG TPA: hypothetical protein VGE85_17000 [Terracidiphilus sp.]|jgi:hypothetical protein
MVRKALLAVLFFAFASATVLAADFNGKWTAEFDTQIGVQKYTYEFHVDGTTVTGKAINERGETAITEGKIDGDTITFVEMLNFNGMDIKITYTGKINGDEIKFTRQVGDFATEELTAKRVK